ncbi:MAG: hypothetical protein IT463_04325 [Planctomycetes bacterium]|nr:hypothetical protein [Planctomycetota bacterium]
MKRAVLLLAVAVAGLVSGCTMFQDDVYKLQAGYYASDSYDGVDNAIHDEFVAKFGKDYVFRADVEWKYNHWTTISDQKAVGHDKYRMRVYAYPQLGADGTYEPVVVARQEVYTGYSTSGRGGPTAMYSGKWSEAGRDVNLEAELANAIAKRLRAPAKGGNAGGK